MQNKRYFRVPHTDDTGEWESEVKARKDWETERMEMFIFKVLQTEPEKNIEIGSCVLLSFSPMHNEKPEPVSCEIFYPKK